MKQSWTGISGRVAAWAALLWSNAAGAQLIAPEPPPPLDPWYEALQFGLFADAYASINTNFPKPQENANGFAGRDDSLRAYDTNSGMSLSWVGVDVGYEPAPVGGALGLRLGPTAHTYSASCLSTYTRCDADVPGLGLVKQAYASWRPGGLGGELTLDFGKFDTIYGAEVAESHLNLNYTRGALYWLGQPLFHTGLRGVFDLWPELSVVALAVNGWNNTIDNNMGKTFGVQLAVRPTPDFAAYLGWLGGPEQDDSALVACPEDTAYNPRTGDCFPVPNTPAATYNVDQGGANSFEAWRHLADLVLLYVPVERLQLALNADFGWEGVRTNQADGTVDTEPALYYGAMLAGRYALSETFAVAARGEYFGDRDGLQTEVVDLKLVTGTLTLEASPNDFLLLRLEGRGDFTLDAEGSNRIFKRSVRDGSSHMVTSTLGVVVKTN